MLALSLRQFGRTGSAARALSVRAAAPSLRGKKSGSKSASAGGDADFPGAKTSFTYEMEFRDGTDPLPCFRVMDERAEVHSEHDPGLPKETLVRMYDTMVRLKAMDDVMLNAQRQGRSSFYMTHSGEEGLLIGSAAALEDTDEVFGQYRETGVLLWRGFGIRDCMNQLLSNDLDIGKGRQMPVHYGSPKHHFQTISSPLATQIPQAVGASFAKRFLQGVDDHVVAVYFGEGAASEGDFHAAINFASTLDCPTLFMCRNNGFAISTPASEQFRGDGVGGRGPAYAVHTLRVDGNDIFAVYAAVKAAREFAVANSRPVLIETMSYRLGSHSTSDDASRYRSEEEVTHWKTNHSPINRLRLYLEGKGWWTDAEEEELKSDARKEVLEALANSERRKKPAIKELFTDVYSEPTDLLKKQQVQLKEHLDKHGSKYGLEIYAGKDL